MNTRFLTFDNYGRAEQAKSANLLRRIENNINQFHDDKLVFGLSKDKRSSYNTKVKPIKSILIWQ